MSRLSVAILAAFSLSLCACAHPPKEPPTPPPHTERPMTQPLSETWFYLAATLWGEARNQPEEGMRAIGHVIMNRASHDRRSVKDTVLAPHQFSCWSAGDPNSSKLTQEKLDRLPATSPDGMAWSRAKIIAAQIINGESKNPVGLARYYHTTGVNMVWDDNLTKVAQIGNHLFYA